MTDTKTFEHFKFTLPIIKTRSEVVKNEKGEDKEVRYVTGVASGTDLDLHGDRMDPSAIESMAESIKFRDVPLNSDHDTSWSAEIGPVKKLEVTDNFDLILEAELSEMSKANDLWYALTTQNKKLGLSIGGYVKEYEMIKEEYDDEKGEKQTRWVRHYKNIALDHVAVTSSPAYPKAWVGAIAKSIKEDSELMIKKLEEKGTNLEKTTTEEKSSSISKEKKLREIARQIVRTIQNLEADLLLELTYAGLNILSESQVQLLNNLMLERSNSMTDVSLETDKAKKADTEAKPEKAEDKTSVTPENESKDKTSKTAGADEAKPTEDKGMMEGDACTTSDGKKGHVKDGKCVPETKSEEKKEEKSEDSGKLEEKVEEKTETKKEEAKSEKTDDDKTSKKVEEKPLEGDSELLKTVKELNTNLQKALEDNVELKARLEKIEAEPAGRKTIEINKEIGDEEVTEKDAKSLEQERDEKIAELREKHSSDPNLFSKIQRVRHEYSKKIAGIA